MITQEAELLEKVKELITETQKILRTAFEKAHAALVADEKSKGRDIAELGATPADLRHGLAFTFAEVFAEKQKTSSALRVIYAYCHDTTQEATARSGLFSVMPALAQVFKPYAELDDKGVRAADAACIQRMLEGDEFGEMILREAQAHPEAVSPRMQTAKATVEKMLAEGR